MAVASTWDFAGADWDDPDPREPLYFNALQEALKERVAAHNRYHSTNMSAALMTTVECPGEPPAYQLAAFDAKLREVVSVYYDHHHSVAQNIADAVAANPGIKSVSWTYWVPGGTTWVEGDTLDLRKWTWDSITAHLGLTDGEKATPDPSAFYYPDDDSLKAWMRTRRNIIRELKWINWNVMRCAASLSFGDAASGSYDGDYSSIKVECYDPDFGRWSHDCVGMAGGAVMTPCYTPEELPPPEDPDYAALAGCVWWIYTGPGIVAATPALGGFGYTAHKTFEKGYNWCCRFCGSGGFDPCQVPCEEFGYYDESYYRSTDHLYHGAASASILSSTGGRFRAELSWEENRYDTFASRDASVTVSGSSAHVTGYERCRKEGDSAGSVPKPTWLWAAPFEGTHGSGGHSHCPGGDGLAFPVVYYSDRMYSGSSAVVVPTLYHALLSDDYATITAETFVFA